MKRTIALYAPAKINLFLKICERRCDGYHNIESIMQTVSLYDKVRVSVKKSRGIEVIVNGHPQLSNENNIAFKAAFEYMPCFIDKTLGITIEIEKNIPVSAGLGGGSSDAAATLIGLNTLNNNALNQTALMKLGAKIGADVPFCIHKGTAFTKGVGEIIDDCPPLGDCTIVIVKAGSKESTKEMYKKWDMLACVDEISSIDIFNALKQKDIKKTATNLHNSFAAVCDGNTAIIKKIFDSGAIGYNLSGSGPSVFAMFDHSLAAEELYMKLRMSNLQSFIVKPVGAGDLYCE